MQAEIEHRGSFAKKESPGASRSAQHGKCVTETGTEPVAVATGLSQELPACYRRWSRTLFESLFGQSHSNGNERLVHN